MIKLKKITKVFNAGRPAEFVALKDVNIEIPANSVTVFAGPSGSGKTTLLSIVGCMARPTSGRITMGEREVTSLPEKFLARIRRSTFGFVFQDYNLIRGLSVLENTMLPAYPSGEAYRSLKNRAMDLLTKLNIANKANRSVEELSGGERQRAAIARALVNEPSVVIADEPTAHLDKALTNAFLDIVADLAGQGKTILMASHDPLVVNAHLIDRVVQLRDGLKLDVH